MLSYIHAFHAGNSGDILKHIIFSLTLEYLTKKDKPFTVIDTHAASGKYLLNDERLVKTGEAESGIINLLSSDEHKFSQLKDLKYISLVKEYSAHNYYPGSPEIARNLMRSQDELILNELHPQVIHELKSNMHSPLLSENIEIPHISIHNRNAIEMLNAVVPPKIKRGCVIIDPSYEDQDDYSDTAEMTIQAYKKWANATYLIWYPLVEHRSSELARMKEIIESVVEQHNSTEESKTAVFELKTKDPSSLTGLSKMYGSGIIAINPPYGLEEKMNQLLPVLTELLSETTISHQ